MKEFKVYKGACEDVKSQFAYGHLDELDTTEYSSAFSCLPLEKKTKSKVFLGFEWETDAENLLDEDNRVDNYNERVVSSILKKALSTPIANYLNYREEASKYLELVSIPATLGYHKKMLLRQFFANKLHHGFIKNEDCGFHVHIDNKALNNSTVLNMIWLLSDPKNRKFINKCAGRDIVESGWCDPYPVSPIYKDGKIVSTGVEVEKGPCDDDYLVSIGYINKEICLNTKTGFGTSELRIFASPQTYAGLAKNLEFTEALVKYSKKNTLDKISVENFKAFIKARRRRYCHLYRFLKLNKS